MSKIYQLVQLKNFKVNNIKFVNNSKNKLNYNLKSNKS